MKNNEAYGTFEAHKDAVTTVAFSPYGHQLASGSADTSIKIWNLYNGQQLRTLNGHSESVNSLCFSLTGFGKSYILASGSADGTVKVWGVL
jgi:WD40 repeat protein